MNKTILLTGSNGFVGSFLLKSLVNFDYKILILLREDSNLSRIEKTINNYSTIKEIKISNYQESSKIFENNKIDYVAHLATNYIKEDRFTDISSIIDSNIAFPAHLLELSKKYNVKGFINTGTFFEYDQFQNSFNEATEIKPYNFYAKSKNAFQKLLESYEDNFPLLTLKLFSPYGPMDNNKVIPYMINSMINDKEISLLNSSESCDFTYVEDISSAFIQAIKHIETKNLKKEINICSGTYSRISEVISILETILNKDARISYKTNDIKPHKSSSFKVAKDELGWEPVTSLEDGLIKTVNYYKELI